MFLRYELRFFSKRKHVPKKKIFKRNLFLVSLEYKVALDEVDKQLNDHRAFLEECYSKNLFITSGRKVPRTGGIIIASIPNRDTLEEVLKKDPFYQKGIANYEITEFIPTLSNEKFSSIAEEDHKITRRF